MQCIFSSLINCCKSKLDQFNQNNINSLANTKYVIAIFNFVSIVFIIFAEEYNIIVIEMEIQTFVLLSLTFIPEEYNSYRLLIVSFYLNNK